MPGASVFACAFSQDGAYFYGGGNVGNAFAGFAVERGDGRADAVWPDSPFDSSAGNPVGYATDASGRVFVSNVGSGVRAFTSSAAGMPHRSDRQSVRLGSERRGSRPRHAVGFLHGRGSLGQGRRVPDQRDRDGDDVGGGAGSPFASGGTFTDALAQDRTGTLLFAANGNSRNITTFRVAAVGTALTSLTTQAVNAAGAAGYPHRPGVRAAGTGGFVYALDRSMPAPTSCTASP